MKVINISWAAFWIGLFTWFSVWVYEDHVHPMNGTDNQDADVVQCAKNNGVIRYDSVGQKSCQIYITPTKASVK